MRQISKLKTFLDLGLVNIYQVGFYKVKLKLGIHPVQKLRGTLPKGPFFKTKSISSPIGAKARDTWCDGEAQYFCRTIAMDSAIPDWFANPYNKSVRASSNQPWWQIPDFDPNLGDIKTVWEASRFDWVIPFAQRAACGNYNDIEKLNDWINDWTVNNPAYLGVNWKCGQEASIRVMQLCLALLLLGQTSSVTKDLLKLIKLHLRRIAPTLSYAIAQDNNHGTSEAAALFIGGSLLVESEDNSEAKRWEKIGRKWMEDRVLSLIAEDGSFSQYSVTYHRLLMDTCNLVEIWRRHFKREKFSSKYYDKMRLASNWIIQMIDPRTGDIPNLGANDGSRIMALCDSDYRDLRPTGQMSAVLFQNGRVFGRNGLWNQSLIWLGIDLPKKIIPAPSSHSFDAGGIHVLRAGRAVAYLKYPRYRFRPRQADALHCDIWNAGENIARDAGSFCYNYSSEMSAYFNGTKAHNTIQFDDRDQMPRISRFLFGNWLKSKEVMLVNSNGYEVNASASYCDNQGVFHKRIINLKPDYLICRDEISGFKEHAVLRWRLCKGDWRLDGDSLSGCGYRLSFKSDIPISRIDLTMGEESLYYMERTRVPILEVELKQSGFIETCFHFPATSSYNLN